MYVKLIFIFIKFSIKSIQLIDKQFFLNIIFSLIFYLWLSFLYFRHFLKTHNLESKVMTYTINARIDNKKSSNLETILFNGGGEI